MELTDDEILTCVRVLRAIEGDRAHLAKLTEERRRELLTLAGLVRNPSATTSRGWRRRFAAQNARLRRTMIAR